MNITLSIGEQLVRELLKRLTAQDDGHRDVEEFRRLSREARGQSRGWKLDRDELRERS